MSVSKTLPRAFQVILVFCLLIIVYCAVNPVTGKKEFMLYTERDEIQLGAATDKEIIATYGLYDDPGLNAYLEDIGRDIAVKTHRPHLQYSFKVLDTPVINAFAVPGGYIYFTRGILAYFNNEAELAGVLGHELGHVNARHSMKQYTNLTLAQLGLGLGSMLWDDFRKVAGLAQVGVTLLFLRFSRDNEREADALGVEYASKAGYDGSRMANFFETLERLNPESASGGLPTWFSTHPSPVDRVAAIQNHSREWNIQLPDNPRMVHRDNYLPKIDGIVYGDDPRQGYVSDNTFYHPVMRFSFPVPRGWNVNNTPSQVQLISGDEKAVILFTLDSLDTPQAAENHFVRNSKASIESSRFVSVNSLNARELVSNIAAETDSLKVLSYFIQMDGSVYNFHGFTSKNLYGQYNVTFFETMNRFQRLTDVSKMNVRPKRLTLKTTAKSGSLRTLLIQYKVQNSELENMAILNGMHLDDQVSTGTLIKIVL